MSWFLILIVYDKLTNGTPWMDSEAVLLSSEKECKEQIIIWKKSLQTVNTMVCLRK